MEVKTHTFKLGRYCIYFTKKIGGVADIPDKRKESWKNQKKEMIIVNEPGIEGLDNILHEALHASGISDEYLHDKNGDSVTRPIARFIWRLGYRKKR